MKKQAKITAALLMMSLLGGCATPHVVQTKQVGDSEMSCNQIKAAYAEAQEFENKARQERTVTGKNVAAAIFFWPALLGTYSNTEEAINAAKERQSNLEKIAEKKGCVIG